MAQGAVLYGFLQNHKREILAVTERKSVELAGIRPSSEQLKRGLPIFFGQLAEVLRRQQVARLKRSPERAEAPSSQLAEAALTKEAGLHGTELLRLGYTLSHVVHAYGAMCQSITELAARKRITITANEFHDLNRCLDSAIAGAVTGFQGLRDQQTEALEIEHLGFLAHELRNALSGANVSLQLIESGTVGFGGSTGQVLKKSMSRIDELIERSLTEVRLRMDPLEHAEPVDLLELVAQMSLTAEVEARSRGQILEIDIPASLVFEADQQLAYSAISNLIQNAVKFTRPGGKILVRGRSIGECIVVEVEDECGGLKPNAAETLFRPYAQQNANRTGLGLGLTIAQRAVGLIRGSIEVRNIAGRGCVFKVTLPKTIRQGRVLAASAA